MVKPTRTHPRGTRTTTNHESPLLIFFSQETKHPSIHRSKVYFDDERFAFRQVSAVVRFEIRAEFVVAKGVNQDGVGGRG